MHRASDFQTHDPPGLPTQGGSCGQDHRIGPAFYVSCGRCVGSLGRPMDVARVARPFLGEAAIWGVPRIARADSHQSSRRTIGAIGARGTDPIAALSQTSTPIRVRAHRARPRTVTHDQGIGGLGRTALSRHKGDEDRSIGRSGRTPASFQVETKTPTGLNCFKPMGAPL